jgi:hypothetical protein
VKWDGYEGDMSGEFVIESGKPEVKGGVLVVPLLKADVPQAESTILYDDLLIIDQLHAF